MRLDGYIGILIIALVIYGITLLRYAWKFRRKMESTIKNGNKDAYPITVIIPFRNEKEKLPDLLFRLINNKPSNSEILFVDDHSEDGGGDWVKKRAELGECKYIKLGEKRGKKEAIAAGILVAQGHWIQILDADCLPLEGYWEKIGNAAKQADLLAGGLIFEGKGLLGAYQVLENSSLVVFGAIDITDNHPSMANGGNMGFLKSHFLQVEGYSGNQQIAGGDDIFIIEKFKNAGYSIEFHFDKESWVKTEVEKSFSTLISQRKRWLQKVRYLKNKWAMAKQVAISLMFIFILLTVILNWKWGIIFFITKCILDGIFFYLLSSYFQIRRHVYWLIGIEILQLILVPWLVLTSSWFSYDWKGRSYLQNSDQTQK